MATANPVESYLDSLKSSLAAHRARVAAWEDEVERQRQAFAAKGQALIGLIEAEQTGSNVVPITAAASASAKDTLAISDERLDKIRKLIKKRGSMRQADIASELGFNSGTVSVGLRRLVDDGEVEAGDKERGSRVWNFVKTEAQTTEETATPTEAESPLQVA